MIYMSKFSDMTKWSCSLIFLYLEGGQFLKNETGINSKQLFWEVLMVKFWLQYINNLLLLLQQNTVIYIVFCSLSVFLYQFLKAPATPRFTVCINTICQSRTSKINSISYNQVLLRSM